MQYQCWGEDKEDLTEKVEVATAALPDDGGTTVVFGVRKLLGRDKPRGARKVMVTCAKGHENVFTIGA